MKHKKFCAFILTHGRPNRVITYKTLRKLNYTGKIFLVVDDKDKALQEYKEKFGDEVLVFSKEKIAKTFDEAGRFNDMRTIVYARNACFELAKQVNCDYFIQLDDDYNAFSYRFDNYNDYKHNRILNLDAVFDIVLDFYKSVDCLTVAFAQGGDYLGGEHGNSPFVKEICLRRKAMNSFFCSTKRPFKFFGRINEDVNAYTFLGRQGKLILTFSNASINQGQTQSNEGGMTEVYIDQGTYVKSFYTIMFSPSCVKITDMSSTNRRIHHLVNWNNATPMIISEKHKAKR